MAIDSSIFNVIVCLTDIFFQSLEFKILVFFFLELRELPFLVSW